MGMDFKRKLPTPMEIKEQYPVPQDGVTVKSGRDREIADIFDGKSRKFILVIGLCSGLL